MIRVYGENMGCMGATLRGLLQKSVKDLGKGRLFRGRAAYVWPLGSAYPCHPGPRCRYSGMSSVYRCAEGVY